MATITATVRQRLERVFEQLKQQGITPVLMLTGSTGSYEDNLAEYRVLAKAAGTPSAWAGAHAGAEQTGGAHWVDGGLYHRATGHAVHTLWFSYSDSDTAAWLLAAAEDHGFPVALVGDEIQLRIMEEDDR